MGCGELVKFKHDSFRSYYKSCGSNMNNFGEVFYCDKCKISSQSESSTSEELI